MKKIVLECHNGFVLVLWKENKMPFVTACTGVDFKIGDFIKEWYWGNYFADLESALKDFKERSGKIFIESEENDETGKH